MKLQPIALGLSLAAAAFASHQASAYEASDIILRVGAATVAPDESSSELSSPALGGRVAGSSASVDDNTQLGITGTWMLTPNLGLGLLAATPFEHDVEANTGVLSLGTVDAGSVKHLPPTLTVQYHFLPEGSVRPYVGAGLNYTNFSSVKLPAGFDVDRSSFGAAFQAGVDIPVGKGVYLNLDLKKVYIRTDLLAAGASIGKVKVDPILAGVGIGWRF